MQAYFSGGCTQEGAWRGHTGQACSTPKPTPLARPQAAIALLSSSLQLPLPASHLAPCWFPLPTHPRAPTTHLLPLPKHGLQAPTHLADLAGIGPATFDIPRSSPTSPTGPVWLFLLAANPHLAVLAHVGGVEDVAQVQAEGPLGAL